MNIDKVVKQLNKDFPELRWETWEQSDGQIGCRQLNNAVCIKIDFFMGDYKNYQQIKTDILYAIKSIKGEK